VDTRKREFEVLIGPHIETLYKAAYRLTRQSHDAEDLVQDVCLRAYASLDTLRQLDYPPGWLLRVQYRLFVDADRRRRRSPVRTVSGADETEAWASEHPGPEALTEAALNQRRLSAAWQRLSTEQRALLGLHAEGYGLAELEQITGKSRNVLSARLHRARRRLSRLLDIDAPRSEPINTTVNRNEL
jgi:RNA polymerase sigma-70 factor (ECF subfamily)